MKYIIKLGDNKWELEENKQLKIGRVGHGANIELESKEVSRQHCLVTCMEGALFVKDLGSKNGTYMNGSTIVLEKNIRLHNGDSFSISGYEFFVYLEKNKNPGPIIGKSEIERTDEINQLKELERKGILTIGRDERNDIHIADPAVSRKHARLIYENRNYWIEDLGSLNGTFVNGDRISSKTKITINDEITISLTSINLGKGVRDVSKQKIAISAFNIEKKYPNGNIGISPLSIEIESGTFVALMGTSGCGKSTLLKCLNNDNPASSGTVLIKGQNLSTHFNAIKKKIGYVPQDDIIHKELTVYQTLFYAAKLRLPDDTTNEEIDSKINKVLRSLKLDEGELDGGANKIRETHVDDLSGGQRKRVSIAVELLVEPTILFLDEPTSPLDPESIDSFLKSIRELAKNGMTVVMVTHKPEDLKYVDNVLFLMTEGRMTYYGNPEGIFKRFGVNDIIEVYGKLSNKNNHDVNVNRYYIRPSQQQKSNYENEKISIDKDHDVLRQLYWLTSRYFKIKITDTNNLGLLLAQPVIIAGLIGVIFDELQIGVLFLMAISAIWFGVSNAAKEIVGEQTVFRRERMFNQRLNTYILSKWIVLSVVAAVQSVIFVLILYVKFQFTETQGIYLYSYGTNILIMFYLATSATLIGLLLSSYFTSTERVMTVVPIALMPQIMLSGVITKIDNVVIEILSFFTLGRWGTEMFGRIQDSGFDNSGSILAENPAAIENAELPEFVKRNANAILNFYNPNSDLIGGIFDCLQNNLLAVTALNIVVYLLIYFSLKKKHSV